MVVRLPYKSELINSNILETLKDRPNTPPSLKLFIEQRVHELIGGSTDPPQTTLWGARSLDQEVLKKNVFNHVNSQQMWTNFNTFSSSSRVDCVIQINFNLDAGDKGWKLLCCK